MKRNLLTFILILVFTGVSIAQPVMRFKKNNHDFGTIHEERGTVKHEFVFTNEGDQPLVITEISTSCGCTAPYWTSDPVMPGKEGTVTAEFDPAERPGKFQNTITIRSNAKPHIAFVSISGEVIKRQKTDKDVYPTEWGNIRVRIPHYFVGTVKDNEDNVYDYKRLYNATDRPITIHRAESPSYIKINPLPSTVYPGQTVDLYISYDATVKKGQTGQVFDEVELHTDDFEMPIKKFKVFAIIERFIDKNNPEPGASIEFIKTTHNFGYVNEGEVRETKFKFTNTGIDDLVIDRLLTGCGCTATAPEKKVIKPGESSYITVSFDSSGRRGPDAKSIDVFTNDPLKPVTRLMIRSNIVVSQN